MDLVKTASSFNSGDKRRANALTIAPTKSGFSASQSRMDSLAFGRFLFEPGHSFHLLSRTGFVKIEDQGISAL